MNLNTKIIVITGASSGIGRQTAVAAAQRGASTVLVARRLDRLQQLAEQIGDDRAIAIQADISKEADVKNMIEAAIKRFGRIDVLINNAGTGLYAKVEETTTAQMERIWRTNFLGTFFCIRHTLPLFKAQKSGHIITVVSMAGRRGSAFKSAYSATKFAQVGLMESLRMELQGTDIHCTLVFPGSAETEFLQAMENPAGREVHYYGPVQSPAKIARAVLQAIEKRPVEVVTQPMGRLQMTLHALAPGFVDWLVRKTIKRERKED